MGPMGPQTALEGPNPDKIRSARAEKIMWKKIISRHTPQTFAYKSIISRYVYVKEYLEGF